jgi:pimeloyl-ACP methyl ester carboxylesterase
MRFLKIFLPLAFVFLFVFSSCQKVDLENQMSEESKAIAVFDNGEIVVKLPVTVKESDVFVEKNEKGIINTKIINGVRVSPSYKLALHASTYENLKNEDDIVIGLRAKDFVDGYDFFYVTFNGNIEFPWIGKAIKNEKEDIVYFKISGMLLKEFLKGQKFDKLVIEFNLVRNPDYQKKAFESRFYLLKYQNGVFTMTQNVTPPPAGQRPVIIIHGWQLPSWSEDYESYVRGVSEGIVKYLTSLGLENKYEFYGFAYDPDYDIYYYSAPALAQYISRYFGSSDSIILIAHSMGGIVARVYNKYYRNKPVKTIITLGTPHHGTPFANLIFGGYVVPFVVPINPWLRWDNLYWTWAMYVHFYLFDGNPYLDALNYNYPNWARLHAFSGYSISSSHPFYYVSGDGLLRFMGFGDNDGLIPLSSARADNYSPIRWYFYDTDHSELTSKSTVLNTIYNIVK